MNIVPVDHDRKCIFIHIPKNAGSTVEKVLGVWEKNNSIKGSKEWMVGPISTFDKLRYGLYNEADWQHLTAIKIKKVLGQKQFRKYFSFAIVRNPWDRMISWYHYLDVKVEFCKWVISPYSFKKYVPLERLIKPQMDYITDKSGKVIVDKIMRFESFKNDFNSVCKTLGIIYEQLPHLKKAERRPYQEYYTTAESILAVKNMFSKDIELLKYEFEH